jgi:beta-galactosidase/beta-glucuronidase
MINVPAVKKITCLLTLLIWQFCPDLAAQGTVFQYLSGTGPDDAVPWEFYCTAGSNSGKWTTIPVPSNWEFHGFGTYNYGHDKNKGKEEGWYRHRFNLPASARDKQVSIVFEGSMTDTYVSVNGRPAGPVHQGAFYRFQYDISSLIKPGKENVLEVKVAKESSNFSVNQAERDADYWVFGGIYRPVYLAISPRDHIVRTAIDARANGSFRMQVVTSVLSKGIKLQAHLLDLKGKPVAESYSTFIQTSDTLAELHAQVNRPRLWNAEQPNLYQVAVELVAANGQVVHTVRERFGFRTIDVRRGDGIYINGNKVIMKGVNRHCTWPSTGKTLSRAQSLQDA